MNCKTEQTGHGRWPRKEAEAHRPELLDGVGLIVGIDRFMSEARAVTNFSGNAMATLLVGSWTKTVDNERVGAVLGGQARSTSSPCTTMPTPGTPGHGRLSTAFPQGWPIGEQESRARPRCPRAATVGRRRAGGRPLNRREASSMPSIECGQDGGDGGGRAALAGAGD